MKKIIVFVLILIAIVGVLFFFLMNKPHKNVVDEKGIKIGAAQLFVEYTANEKIANEKFLNNAIEVNGVVSLMNKNQDGQQFIVLKTDDDFYGIMCTMSEPVTAFEVGEKITVKGYCSGFTSDVKLTDCILIAK